MRILVMGTGEFAVPTFKKLIDDPRHEVMGLVAILPADSPSRPLASGVTVDSQPIKSALRSREISPMEKVAHEKKITVFHTDDINSFAFSRFIYLMLTDLLFVCDFGAILSQQVLRAAKYGGINLHGSLLPKYRGAAPVHWAILNGDKTTGVSLIRMSTGVDAGPVVATSDPVPIGAKETVLEVERKLAQIGSDLVLEVVNYMATGEHLPILPQKQEEVTRAPKIKKHDGLIDWSKPAEFIRNHYRAMYPWPASYTFWHSGEGKTLRLKLGPFTVVTHPTMAGPPGTVLIADGKQLLVATGKGAVRVDCIHPDGKKQMEAAAFMRGYHIKSGDQLGELRAEKEWSR